MSITEDDLPDEWTLNYGAFINLGDSVVMGTCRICYSMVVSDFFVQHTTRHAKLEGVHLERRTTQVAIGPDGQVL